MTSIFLPEYSPAQEIEVRFSPRGRVADAICEKIAAATRKIHCQAYHLTSVKLLKAFLDARGRGVECFFVLDETAANQDYSIAATLRNAGCAVLVDGMEKINHNKVIVIDDDLVITGSYNFTAAAETKNAENCVFIRHRPTAEAFLTNWKLHAAHSVAFPAKPNPSAAFLFPTPRPH